MTYDPEMVAAVTEELVNVNRSLLRFARLLAELVPEEASVTDEYYKLALASVADMAELASHTLEVRPR